VDDLREPDARLDVTRDVCPITFAKTKLELEELAPGQLLDVLLNDGEPLENVTRSVAAEGHAVIGCTHVGGRVWRIRIRRAP
jgi:tRNA 2-thiouridine synthesizing protein A